MSRNITPLVIKNGLGRGQTHTHTHTDNLYRMNFKKPGARWLQAGSRMVYKPASFDKERKECYEAVKYYPPWADNLTTAA